MVLVASVPFSRFLPSYEDAGVPAEALSAHLGAPDVGYVIGGMSSEAPKD